jgi:hypothetical protein
MLDAVRGASTPSVSEDDIDAVLDEFGGDAREAIRALLGDIDTLARDHAATVSVGYVRGAVFRSGLYRRGKRS